MSFCQSIAYYQMIHMNILDVLLRSKYKFPNISLLIVILCGGFDRWVCNQTLFDPMLSCNRGDQRISLDNLKYSGVCTCNLKIPGVV